MRLQRTTELSNGEVDVAKSERETVPQTWSSDSEGAIAETSASALNGTCIDQGCRTVIFFNRRLIAIKKIITINLSFSWTL